MYKDLVVQDHTGRKFCCLSAMCRFYRISTEEFLQRMAEGWTVERALTLYKRASYNKGSRRCRSGARTRRIKDHLGQSFPSVEAMCLYYDIPFGTYMFRRTHGWNLREALMKPVDSFQAVADHLGQRFDSVSDMCKFYNIAVSLFKDRIKSGWDLDKALTVGGDTAVKEEGE